MTVTIEKKKKSGKKITHHKVEGKITKQKKGEDGAETIVEEVGVIISDDIKANVGLKIGRTVNLGNYDSVRVDISLFMPSDLDEDSLNQTYRFVERWVDNKMEETLEEIDEATT